MSLQSLGPFAAPDSTDRNETDQGDTRASHAPRYYLTRAQGPRHRHSGLSVGPHSAAAGLGHGSGRRGSCDPDPGRLLVTFQPIEHSEDATQFRAQLVLANDDRRCALDSDWSLYFNFVRRPLALVPPCPPPPPPGLPLGGGRGGRPSSSWPIRDSPSTRPMRPRAATSYTLEADCRVRPARPRPATHDHAGRGALGGRQVRRSAGLEHHLRRRSTEMGPRQVPAGSDRSEADQAFAGDQQRRADRPDPIRREHRAVAAPQRGRQPRAAAVAGRAERAGHYTLDRRTTITYERGTAPGGEVPGVRPRGRPAGQRASVADAAVAAGATSS